MKNLSRLFLLLLLPLTLCLPRFASASATPSAPQAAYHPLSDIFTNPNALISTAVADGKLYFLLYDRSLLKWDPITQSALPQATVPQAELLIGGDALRLLDYDSGTLLKLSAGACVEDGAIDESALSDERFSIKTAFCFDNFLYLLYTPSMEDWTAHRIACFNLAKPSVTILDIEAVQALAGYQPGKLLALLGDPLAGTPASPVVLDSQTGEVLQVLPALHANAGGMAYLAYGG